jgi:hypothetical protein
VSPLSSSSIKNRAEPEKCWISEASSSNSARLDLRRFDHREKEPTGPLVAGGGPLLPVFTEQTSIEHEFPGVLVRDCWLASAAAGEKIVGAGRGLRGP